MDKRFIAGILLAVGVLLTACAASVEETPSVVETPVETEAVVESAPDASECLACHTDKQKLIDTAKPEEADHEAESKGVG